MLGGFYLLVAKGNQPTLRDDLQPLFQRAARGLPGLAARHARSTKGMDDWKFATSWSVLN